MLVGAGNHFFFLNFGLFRYSLQYLSTLCRSMADIAFGIPCVAQPFSFACPPFGNAIPLSKLATHTFVILFRFFFTYLRY